MHRIALLVPSRPNSAFLARFILRFQVMTANHHNTGLHILLNDRDEWNGFLPSVAGRLPFPNISFHMESNVDGRFALHKYFSQLINAAPPADWYIHACEDFEFLIEDWDNYLRRLICAKGWNPSGVYMIHARATSGYVCPMVSAGYVAAVGSLTARHYSIDTYMANVWAQLPQERVMATPDTLFLDYTHTEPAMAKDLHVDSSHLPYYEDESAAAASTAQVAALQAAIDAEATDG